LSRYLMLVRVLDGIRAEAKGTKHEGRYAVGSSAVDEVWAARARAYIHLYLKVMFGLRLFTEREHFVTDGGRDGGVDGYYIDSDGRTVYIIQSKFRNTESNFEGKPIELSELLAMQIRRVLAGEVVDDQGFAYNGKIKGMQRALGEIYDIGRYSYNVVVLANLEKVSEQTMLRLTENTPFEVINYERSYRDLLYPVLSGTLFKAKGLGITLDLSNKSTGSKIGYTVLAEGIECEITVVYVPTLEIGRILSEYKNSILTYNPRSYLEFEGEKVNSAIRNSILGKPGNDFALLNNGLTVVCDESAVNDRSGRKGKAQLFLLNPQIINGGQTAYTLSRIYESLDEGRRERVFEGKEVLVKAIAVPTDKMNPDNEAKRTLLIENISAATNSQTVVTIADRFSGDPLNFKLQERLFQEHGILYERKRGEFAEGVRNGYMRPEDVVGRTKFARVYLAANGSISRARRKRITVQHLGHDVATNDAKLENAVIGLDAFELITPGGQVYSQNSYLAILPQIRAAVVASSHFGCELKSKGLAGAELVNRTWPAFLRFAAQHRPKRVNKVTELDDDNVLYVLKPRKSGYVGLEELINEFFSNPVNLFNDV
jgi:hypothetical protein